MTIKKGAKIDEVRLRLKRENIIVGQKLDDTHYVVYKKKRKSNEPENTITIPEVHERLNARAGKKIPTRHLSILLSCWRKARGYKSHGRQGSLDLSAADDFLHYAW